MLELTDLDLINLEQAASLALVRGGAMPIDPRTVLEIIATIRELRSPPPERIDRYREWVDCDD